MQISLIHERLDGAAMPSNNQSITAHHMLSSVGGACQ
jgi:hypothetical protein